MSQIYGLLAGLFVCASTWGAMTYLSAEIGWLVGAFLLVFFTTTTIYMNGDEVHERHKGLIKSLTDMESIFLQRLRMIERKIDVIEQQLAVRPPSQAAGPSASPELDTMISMVDDILADDDEDLQIAETTQQVECERLEQLLP